METFQAKAEIMINARSQKIWQALTDPEMVKQYLFGTDMTVSKWEVGGKISYKGVWEGKSYEDKGEILEIIPGKKLVSSYWSGFTGLPDAPENYQKVSYELFESNGATRLVITQDGCRSAESAQHSEQNWRAVLAAMKKLIEK